MLFVNLDWDFISIFFLLNRQNIIYYDDGVLTRYHVERDGQKTSITNKSSSPAVFCEKSLLKNFIFLFWNSACNFTKKGLRVFLWIFQIFSEQRFSKQVRTAFLTLSTVTLFCPLNLTWFHLLVQANYGYEGKKVT